MAKRSRPDIHKTITVLSMKVKAHHENNWKKLVRMIKYLNGTKKSTLI